MPNNETLKKYADVMVKFALWSGEGAKPGDVVLVQIPESAKPFLIHLQNSILEAGAYPIFEYLPEGISRNFLDKASNEQIQFQPEILLKAKAEQITHRIYVICDKDPKELEGADTKKIMMRQKSTKFFREALDKKEDEGKYTWSLCLFATEAMAHEANLSLEEYWQQIIKACFLDENDPIAKWKEVIGQIEDYKDKLNTLNIEKLHIKGNDVDLHILFGESRKWLGGSGRNIPSFEIFTSPDWRGTNGWIKFNQPLYSYGNLIKGIELEFKDGLIISSKATENEQLLREMISTENANKIGEFSLTDKRFSRIEKFMAETLFDENIGGEYGNTHIAIGKSYHDTYNGDIKSMMDEDWVQLGFNDSVVHTDIISTTDRTVTATLKDGTDLVIYKDGMFQI